MKKMLFGSALSAIAMQAAGEGAAAPVAGEQNGTGMAARFTPDQIKEMRDLRAMRYPEGHEHAGKICWSHAALAKKFNTTPGVVSHIVRNRTYKDPDYVPVNDGHLDRSNKQK